MGKKQEHPYSPVECGTLVNCTTMILLSGFTKQSLALFGLIVFICSFLAGLLLHALLLNFKKYKRAINTFKEWSQNAYVCYMTLLVIPGFLVLLVISWIAGPYL